MGQALTGAKKLPPSYAGGKQHPLGYWLWRQCRPDTLLDADQHEKLKGLLDRFPSTWEARWAVKAGGLSSSSNAGGLTTACSSSDQAPDPATTGVASSPNLQVALAACRQGCVPLLGRSELELLPRTSRLELQLSTRSGGHIGRIGEDCCSACDQCMDMEVMAQADLEHL